jgi:hypothetical protein
VRRFWVWLGTNNNSQRVTLLVTVFQTVILIVGLTFAGITLRINGQTLAYNAKTLDESNRIAWRTFLNNKSSDLGREVLNHDALHCVYRYKLPRVDNDCSGTVYDNKNLPQVLEYVLQEIWHLNEIKEYSDQEDKNYYNQWYSAAARDFSDDPSGVVSFVLWEHLGCDHEEPSDPASAEKNCNLARRLGICVADEQYRQEPQHCFDNLAARRSKFLRGVEDAAGDPLPSNVARQVHGRRGPATAISSPRRKTPRGH